MFEAQPPLPPSTAQLIALKKGEEKCAYLTSVNQLLRDRDYSLLLVSFGLNIGVFYAFSTLLNQELLAFPVSILSLLFTYLTCSKSKFYVSTARWGKGIAAPCLWQHKQRLNWHQSIFKILLCLVCLSLKVDLQQKSSLLETCVVIKEISRMLIFHFGICAFYCKKILREDNYYASVLLSLLDSRWSLQSNTMNSAFNNLYISNVLLLHH